MDVGRIEPFECHWQPSRLLLGLYGLVQLGSVVSLALSDIPIWTCCFGLAICAIHAHRTLRRDILQRSDGAVTGLRHDGQGWRFHSRAGQWRAARLLPTSIALPFCIVICFRLVDDRFARAVVLPRDALAPRSHRRLRVRLRFSRQRWAAPE